MRLAIAGGTGVVGSFATAHARELGHDVTILSRSQGVDLSVRGDFRSSLDRIDAVIGATSIATYSRRRAIEFFTTVSSNLIAACAEDGRRLITLSIVGARLAESFGYYAGKVAQEDLLASATCPSQIIRATQFHEFAGQMIERSRRGRFAFVPAMPVKTVAARSIAEELVRAATSSELAADADFVGPALGNLADQARKLVRHREMGVRIVALKMRGEAARAIARGALYASQNPTVVSTTFDEWLETNDARKWPINDG